MPKKLTPVQESVVELMKEGWALGVRSGVSSRVWLQDGELGHGGQTQRVHENTFNSLYRKGIIRGKGARRLLFTVEYVLTEG